MAEKKDAKTVSYVGPLTWIYDKTIREKMVMRIAIIGGPSRIINLTFDGKGEAAYIEIEGAEKDRMRITIGGKHIKEIANLPDRVNRTVLKACIEDINKSFYNTINHELAHALFTDMKSDEIINYPDPKYRGFMHTIFNILEDVVIEFLMTLYYKKHLPYDINPKVYFDFKVQRMFESKSDEYTDDGTQSGFCNYLLLFVRIGEAKIKNKCAIFEKYKADLIPLIKAVLQQPDPTQRVHNTVVLCEWIIENIKEFDWSMPEPPEIEKISGKGAGKGFPMPMPGPEMGSGPGIPGEGGGSGKDSEGDSEDEEGASEGKGGSSEDEEESEGKKESEETEEPEKDEESEDESSMVEKDIDEEMYSYIFNDDIRDGSDHVWSIAKEDFEIKDESIIDDVNNIIAEQLPMIREVSDSLNLFKGRIKPIMTGGMSSGALNVRRAIRSEVAGGLDMKIYQKKVSRGIDVDACYSALCDLSGSMGDTKSEICARGAIALAQACEWANAPCEVQAFVKTSDSPSGISYTIVEKSFEDTFEDAKPFLGINSSTMLLKLNKVNKKVPTFAGNSEEINLYYIWKKLRKVKHKTKILFVLCDGMTTGSKNDLHNIVTKMEQEDGIIVIGIGVLCNEVANIYNHSKVFKSIAELNEGLAPYLVETLNAYIK